MKEFKPAPDNVYIHIILDRQKVQDRQNALRSRDILFNGSHFNFKFKAPLFQNKT